MIPMGLFLLKNIFLFVFPLKFLAQTADNLFVGWSFRGRKICCMVPKVHDLVP